MQLFKGKISMKDGILISSMFILTAIVAFLFYYLIEIEPSSSKIILGFTWSLMCLLIVLVLFLLTDSIASITGTHLGMTIKVGGAAAFFFILLWVGFNFISQIEVTSNPISESGVINEADTTSDSPEIIENRLTPDSIKKLSKEPIKSQEESNKISVTGTLINSDNEPIEGVEVSFMGRDNKIYKGKTNSDGLFTILIEEKNAFPSIEIKCKKDGKPLKLDNNFLPKYDSKIFKVEQDE